MIGYFEEVLLTLIYADSVVGTMLRFVANFLLAEAFAQALARRSHNSHNPIRILYAMQNNYRRISDPVKGEEQYGYFTNTMTAVSTTGQLNIEKEYCHPQSSQPNEWRTKIRTHIRSTIKTNVAIGSTMHAATIM